MDRIWAPWRIQYILGERQDSGGRCIFCAKPEAPDKKSELVLLKRDKCFVMMNLDPYNAGHIMICPYEHVHCVTDLDDAASADMAATTRLVVPALRRVLNAQGFNIGYNIGKAAGAGIEEHLHLHVIPRWIGDSNILPVLSETRVISEHIDATWERIHAGLEQDGVHDTRS